MLRDNKMAPDADWLSRRDAMRDKVPPRFSSDELQKRLEEVSKQTNIQTYKHTYIVIHTVRSWQGQQGSM